MIGEQTLRLDGANWRIASDPANVGRAEQWWRGPRPEAVPAAVPGVIVEHFPDYRGVVWYWTEFTAPRQLHADGRYLLRFAAVDYLAEVWVNDVRIGAHEGAEHEPFTLDATAAVRPGAVNRMAVCLLFPGDDPIAGIVFAETPHGCNAHWCATGGIFDAVELLVVPGVRIADLYVKPDWRTGHLKVEVTVHNAGADPVPVSLAAMVGPANAGETLDRAVLRPTVPPGESQLELALAVAQPRPWQLDDPFLYRVTAQVVSGGDAVSERSARCGFRDFRFKDGYFRLNGKRVFLKNSHYAASAPAYEMLPHDPSMLRRDLLNMKCMGFNMVRFIATDPPARLLDLADEIGLMVHAEPYSAWRWRSSPQMPERFDRSLSATIRSGRNHPSVVIWGLLNETRDQEIARRAEASLPLVRRLDPGRVVLLHSGRFDAPVGNYENGLQLWRRDTDTMPNLIFNPRPHGVFRVPLWPARSLSLHPGASGEHAVLRFTAPRGGAFRVRVEFRATAPFVQTSTDVQVRHNGRPLYDDFINLCARGERRAWAGEVLLAAGDRLDIGVGPGAGYQPPMPTPCDAMASPWISSTQVTAVLEAPDGTAHDAVAGFSAERNPNGPWSYGWRPAASPDAAAFTPFARCEERREAFAGGLSNPGSLEWEDTVSDHHIYLRTPHRAREIEVLRTVAGDNHPLYLSEYGVGSGVDFPRLLRHYERIGGTRSRLYRTEFEPMAAAFLKDWQRWRLDEAFAGPADFFRQSLGRMAGLRKLGLNALRSNPRLVAHSLTMVYDPLHVGEGVLTAFREPKPGAFDAIADGFAPLRWCLFAEPAHIYSGAKVRLEAVLANEDHLPPGKYPVRLRVADPHNRILLDERVEMDIPALEPGREPSFAIPVFAREIAIEGPTGKYRLLAEFEKGAAAAGEEIIFHVMNRADMPPVEQAVTLWSDDPELETWLTRHGITTRPFEPRGIVTGGVILISTAPAGGCTEACWRELESAIAAGVTAIFLDPGVFARGGEPLGWLPLATQGVCECDTPELYPKDEWAKAHPIFAGLPAGGLMDYAFYREIIPDLRFKGLDAPDEAVAGAFRTSLNYRAELMLAVYRRGRGRMILNTLRIRQELGRDPVAERLLRNMINYAGGMSWR